MAHKLEGISLIKFLTHQSHKMLDDGNPTADIDIRNTAIVAHGSQEETVWSGIVKQSHV